MNGKSSASSAQGKGQSVQSDPRLAQANRSAILFAIVTGAVTCLIVILIFAKEMDWAPRGLLVIAIAIVFTCLLSIMTSTVGSWVFHVIYYGRTQDVVEHDRDLRVAEVTAKEVATTYQNLATSCFEMLPSRVHSAKANRPDPEFMDDFRNLLDSSKSLHFYGMTGIHTCYWLDKYLKQHQTKNIWLVLARPQETMAYVDPSEDTPVGGEEPKVDEKKIRKRWEETFVVLTALLETAQKKELNGFIFVAWKNDPHEFRAHIFDEGMLLAYYRMRGESDTFCYGKNTLNYEVMHERLTMYHKFQKNNAKDYLMFDAEINWATFAEMLNPLGFGIDGLSRKRLTEIKEQKFAKIERGGRP